MKPHPGLKPGIRPSGIIWLWVFATLTNVLLDHFFIGLPHRLGKIPVRPETVPPQKFLQIRKLPPHLPARSPLEYLDNLSHSPFRWNLNHNMMMIFANRDLADPPPAHAAGFVHQFLQADGYFALENSFAIFGYPYQMILKSMFCMGARGVPGLNQIMPDWPPLRQLKLASFRVPFIPRLEMPGFSGIHIKRSFGHAGGTQDLVMQVW